MRVQTDDRAPQEVGTMEAVRAKVLVKSEGSEIRDIKVELTSENDLFLHYVHIVDESSFSGIQEDQKLMIEFQDYASVLVRMLNSAIKEPDV